MSANRVLLSPTPRQQQILKQLLALHGRPPSWRRSLFKLMRIILVWSVLLAACVVVTGGEKSPLLPWSAGFITGLIGANVAGIRLSMRKWAVLEAVIEWERVGKLASLGDERTA